MQMYTGLKNKHIVIVGGSSGIGLAVASLAVEVGAQVTIASRSQDKLRHAKQLLADKYDVIVNAQILDVSDESQVKDFCSQMQRINHLVATIKPEHIASPFLQTKSDDHHSAMQTKYWGQYYLALHAVPKLSTTGSMVFTSGIASARGYVGFSGTSAINGALESLTRALAVELAPIRVNTVSPGFIERHENDNKRYKKVTELQANIPLQRLGNHLEVAQAYLYLLNNTYMTGQIITVDGGELS